MEFKCVNKLSQDDMELGNLKCSFCKKEIEAVHISFGNILYKNEFHIIICQHCVVKYGKKRLIR